MKISILIFISLIISQYCCCQDRYNNRLDQILSDIRHLTYFNNGVVTYSDSSGYGSMYPYWTSSEDFFEDDVVAFERGTAYRARINNRGKTPATSAKEWELMQGSHPYLFLRDSAQLKDLVHLLKSDHAYHRVYAFAALVNRKADSLFQIVVDNLGDTTRIEQMTSDYGYTVYPADLMLCYTIEGFSTAQKEALKEMILMEHSYLTTLDDILLFLKPTPERYQYVRQIAERGTFGDAALVALSRYKKPEDIELIRKGFKENSHYAGFGIFFIAIGSFPDNAFQKDLIAQKTRIRMDQDMSGYMYYFNALATYGNKDCLRVLEEFVNQPRDTAVHRAAENRVENLGLILQALKRKHNKIYDRLIKKIEGQISKQAPYVFSKQTPYDFYNHQLERSPWNR